MELHERLQELRKQKGLTREELARQLYVSRMVISKRETGRGDPGIDSLGLNMCAVVPNGSRVGFAAHLCLEENRRLPCFR